MSESAIKSMKNLPQEHILGEGTSLCAGCGGLGVLHQIYDMLGEKTVIVNAAGCMTSLAIYPYTPFRGSWLYTAMASAASGAQGIRDALDMQIAQGRLPKEDDLTVVALAGDGSSYGMGLSATSSAIERNLDFLYICYDNEGYGNTGQQFSAATPWGARTTTSRGGHHGKKKDLFAIWTAHHPVYAATIIGSEPLDLARKVEKAISLRGPRLLLAMAPCPTGWGYDPQETVEIGRLAVRCGIWPLKEFEDGALTHTRIPQPRIPVEEYLQKQSRFRHLFKPQRNAEAIAHIQADVDRYWSNVT